MSGLVTLGAREPSRHQPGEACVPTNAALAIQFPRTDRFVISCSSRNAGVPCAPASIRAGLFFQRKPARSFPPADRAAGIVSVWAEAAGAIIRPRVMARKFLAREPEFGDQLASDTPNRFPTSVPHAQQHGEKHGPEVGRIRPKSGS